MEDLKVGDRVEVMNVWSWYMGQFGVVKKVNKHVQSNTTYYSVLLDTEMKVMNFDKCELRLATKKAAPTTFKIGDKVFINEKCTAYKDLVGKHGIVTDVAVDICKVEFGANDYVWITDEVLTAEAVQLFLADELVLDNDISEKLKSKEQTHHKAFVLNTLNVGDKVIINTKNYGDKYYGKHGTIVTDVNMIGNYEVKLEEFEEYVWILGADLIAVNNAYCQKKLCDDIWHVSAEFMLRDCSGEAFGED